MSKESYLKSGGAECPTCDSRDIQSVSTPQVDAGIIWQDCKCNNCGSGWSDVYELKGITMSEEDK